MIASTIDSRRWGGTGEVRVKIEAIELRRVALPLVTPFRTSFGLQLERDALLVRVITDVGDGWGECVAMAEPLYSSEYADGAQDVMRAHLIPRLFAADDVDAAAVKGILAGVKGHPMAKAALEMAVLDAELRAAGQPFSERLGAVRDAVDCGVSIGIFPTIERAARAGRRLPRRGLQAHQAEDRAGLGLRARARGARTLARHRAAGRRQHRVLTLPTSTSPR